MYPTQFSADLLDDSDRVVEQFLLPEIKAGNLTKNDILTSLESACDDADWNKNSIPTGHAQAELRDFFKKIIATLKLAS